MTTRYEVILETPTGRETIGFSARKTKGALLDFARASSQTILGFIATDADPTPTYSKSWGWTFGPCRIRFSGETEKTARA